MSSPFAATTENTLAITKSSTIRNAEGRHILDNAPNALGNKQERTFLEEESHL